jgi:hypothetical protein
LFSAPQEPRSILGVIGWWELRRIPYNIIVGSVGLCSLLLFFFFITHSAVLQPGEDAVEPLAIIFAPLVINIFYTAGWLVEVFSRLIFRERIARLGPLLLKFGLAFSLLVALFPALYWGMYWLLLSTHIIHHAAKT